MRIWLGRAGGYAVEVMKMLRDNPDGVPVTIYATMNDPDAVALNVADVSETEPDYSTPDDFYLLWALDFVARHGIDVFIPARRVGVVAAHQSQFAALGCRIMCAASSDVASVLTHKGRTYEAAVAAGVPVPPWLSVFSAGELVDSIARLRAEGHVPCVKPAGELSAGGFRIIKDTPVTLDSVLSFPTPVISTVDCVEALRKSENPPELMVMPYLDGPEISADCLSTPDGRHLVSVARSKQGRYRVFLDDPEITFYVHKLLAYFPLGYLTNIQFRYLHGQPVLLEINPRASAGLFHSTFTGVNLYWLAIRLLLSGDAGRIPALRLDQRIATAQAAFVA